MLQENLFDELLKNLMFNLASLALNQTKTKLILRKKDLTDKLNAQEIVYYDV